MRDAAAHVANAFASDGRTWQERPVKPPAYTPTVDDIHELYMKLLAQLVERRPNDVTGRVYDHALSRGLRVARLTGVDEKEQRFVLQAESNVDGRVGYRNVMVVDADGNPAEWTPAPKPQTVTRAELQATVAALEAKIASLQPKADG